MDTLWQDVRYTLRMLRTKPGFLSVAVFTVALGIGANTALFSVVNTVLLRQLPYEDPDRLVVLWERQQQIEEESPSYPNFLDWQRENQSFEQMAIARRDNFNLTGAGEPERLVGRQVSANFFSTLGVQLTLGRSFRPEEDRAAAEAVAVISNGLWKRRFGLDPGIIGNQITLNGKSVTIIGVLPQDFQFYTPADVFVSINLEMPERLKQAREEHGGTVVIARLKPGVSREQAFSDMDNIAVNLEKQYPKTNNTNRVIVRPLYDDLVESVELSLWVLLGAVGLVLLIACANVANLLLARAASRQREMAIRAALGADRLRIVRQLLTESLLIALVGGALGLLVAVWGKDLLVVAIASDIPWVKEVNLDATVLAFTLAASIVTGIIFGLFPALQVSKPDLNESLKEGGRGATSARRRISSILVIAEVALALVLLMGAGLMLRSLLRLNTIDPGFDSQKLLTMSLALSPKYAESPKARAFYNDLQNRLESLPGVEAVAFTTSVPLGGANVGGVLREGESFTNYGDQNLTVQSGVGIDYFRAMGIELLKGRGFTEQENDHTPLVAVIDENLAGDLFKDRDAVGEKILLNEGTIAVEVIGVVAHVKHMSFDSDEESKVRYQLYTNYNQIPDRWFATVTQRMSIVVRAASSPRDLASSVRRQLFEVDRDQPVYDIKTMDERIGEATSRRRFSMTLLGVFAGVALMLAAVGIYGVVSYSVSQRRHEMGIRCALGAQSSDILSLVMGQGLQLTIIGVALGLVGAFALTRVMESLLYKVSPTDPLTFTVTSLLLAGVALGACFVPARRATKVDPMIALRYE